MSNLPLTGVVVVDLTQVYSGPYATFLLAEAGATVIKVEPPEGERLRLAEGALGAPFATFNGGKRSVSIDLATHEGKADLAELLKGADVLVENFRPGVLERLGFGDARLREINRELIRASLSGFGSDGPYQGYAALDIVVQAISGVIATTGFADQPPVKAGAALADILGGTHLYGAIVTALLARERYGQAEHVETSMLAATLPALASSFGPATGAPDDAILRTGNRHGGGRVCPYNVYPAADGHAAIICTTDRHWRTLAERLGLTDLLADEELATMKGRVARIDELDKRIASITRTMDRKELFELLAGGGVPCGPVQSLPESLRDRHLLETGAAFPFEHAEYGPLTLLRGAIRFCGSERPPYRPSPALGEANDEFLASRSAPAAMANHGTT